MTAVEVAFHFGNTPGPREMRALDAVHDVYGIRRIIFNQKEKIIRVEYDASRLTESIVAGLLRRAGIELREKPALA